MGTGPWVKRMYLACADRSSGYCKKGEIMFLATRTKTFETLVWNYMKPQKDIPRDGLSTVENIKDV